MNIKQRSITCIQKIEFTRNVTASLLLARLKQRESSKKLGSVRLIARKVFAESYDKEDDEQIDSSEKYRGGAPGCPNKYNHYHVCTDYCFDHWREGFPIERLPPKYLDQRTKMLKEYPLPLGWKEVYDPGMRRHYYWCQATDEVSWLSPKHPRAVISEAAQKIAKEMLESSKPSSRSEHPQPRRSLGSRDREKDDRRDDTRDSRGRREQGREKRYRGRDPEREARRRRQEGSGSEDENQKGSGNEDDKEAEELSEREKLKRAKRRGIDPMDPAAYGEAEVGAWSSGLASDGVKTGVDVTANGPLFQSRPYPAPGAILRRNNPDAEKAD
uniref:WW domain-containing protein n=1 Tax=Ditylenchus dipsaci TaxID=166011 RepID=A0A915CT95_9BILA